MMQTSAAAAAGIPVQSISAVSSDPPVEAVLAQVERILGSSKFSRSERLSRFLRFVVEESVAGRAGGLKEYTIGTQVYARGDSFDPTTDTIVRVEARRLRSTLKKYYAGEGKSDPVWISVPTGGYEPAFRWKTGAPADPKRLGCVSSVAVLAFDDFGAGGDQRSFCDGITEEIIHALAQIEGLCVAARTSAFAYKGRHHDVRSIGAALDVSALLEGSVRKEGDQLRITAQLVSIADGYHLWSKRFDRQMTDVFAVQEEVAQTIADDLRARLVVGAETVAAEE